MLMTNLFCLGKIHKTYENGTFYGYFRNGMTVNKNGLMNDMELLEMRFLAWQGGADKNLDWTSTAKPGLMYSEEQYRKALEIYEETKSVTKTMRLLGYPTRRQTLYNWILKAVRLHRSPPWPLREFQGRPCCGLPEDQRPYHEAYGYGSRKYSLRCCSVGTIPSHWVRWNGLPGSAGTIYAPCQLIDAWKTPPIIRVICYTFGVIVSCIALDLYPGF